MAWRRPGDKPLSEPMMVRLPTHICVARPQWVNMRFRRRHTFRDDSWTITRVILHCQYFCLLKARSSAAMTCSYLSRNIPHTGRLHTYHQPHFSTKVLVCSAVSKIRKIIHSSDVQETFEFYGHFRCWQVLFPKLNNIDWALSYSVDFNAS